MTDSSKRRWTQNTLSRLFNCCPRVADSRTAERQRVQAELKEDMELEKLRDSAGNIGAQAPSIISGASTAVLVSAPVIPIFHGVSGEKM